MPMHPPVPVKLSEAVPVPVPVPKGPGLSLQQLLGRIAEHTDDVILITEAEPLATFI